MSYKTVYFSCESVYLVIVSLRASQEDTETPAVRFVFSEGEGEEECF